MKRLAAILILAAAMSASAQTISAQYAEAAHRLIAAALEDTAGLARLEHLCDRIGNRLSGSASLERAIEWSAAEGGEITTRGGGGDIRNLVHVGVLGFAAKKVNKLYGNWHHTNADTFDKIVPREFQLNIAPLAVLSYVLADMPERLTDLKLEET